MTIVTVSDAAHRVALHRFERRAAGLSDKVIECEVGLVREDEREAMAYLRFEGDEDDTWFAFGFDAPGVWDPAACARVLLAPVTLH